jgi:hypothetical protein
MNVMPAQAQRIVPLIVAARRRSPQPLEQRVAYALARLRMAGTREPAPRFGHLLRMHD